VARPNNTSIAARRIGRASRMAWTPTPSWRAAVGTGGLLALLVMASSATSAAQGAPGAAANGSPDGVSIVQADIQFMQGMISHHAQALAMVSLIPSRSTRQDVRLLGQRIAISQHDEILLMQHWLQDHQQAVPTVDSQFVVRMPGMTMAGMNMGGMQDSSKRWMMMPGMLTDAEMAALAQATGPAFDRLLLEGMIRHHEGALTMVSNLFHTPGAGQAPDVYAFASGVVADQTAEIARMQKMLAATPPSPSGRGD
jgi:uncharacterized protein (DUF305 family)